jgi:uncharacterized protein (TIGR02147 family)
MIEIYNFDDYREYLKARVDSENSKWGLWAKLAAAASCQPTYLSQVIKGKAHLTSDHVMGIAQFWELSESETDFFLLLLEVAKAGTSKLKDFLFTKIQRIRRDREDIAKRLDKPRIEIGDKESLYYSAWYWSALHIIVSIPDYSTPQAIAKKLLLPVELVSFALEQLERYQIVQRDGKNWKLGTGDVHIPKESPMIGVHHNNWRQRAVLDSTLPGTSGVHYTAVYSLSRQDYQHLKDKMLDLVEYTRKVVGPSKEEEMVCFTCDLFTV